MKEYAAVLLKGAAIGSSMLIPGVSGGTAAILLGIYDRLLSAACGIFRSFRKNAAYLCCAAIGGIIGIALLAGPLLTLTQRFAMPSMWFFTGAVAGGFPLMIGQSGVFDGLRTKKLISGGAGLACGIILLYLMRYLPSVDCGVPALLLAGIILAAGLVLPGISVSHMLLVMGLYEKTLTAVSECDFGFLLPLGLSMLVGTAACVKLIELLLRRAKAFAYLMIAGFMCGSVAEVCPGIPHGWAAPLCAVLAAVGFCAVFLLSFGCVKRQQ